MENTVLVNLGKRIRLYRKSLGLSLEELAAKVYKSKATLSKYELGQIPVDVVTLQNIASALGVATFHLLEMEREESTPTPSINHPFGKASTLYLYHMTNKTIYPSVLQFGPTDQTGQIHVTLYYRVNDPQDIEQCYNIYHGYMHNHDMVISFFLRNYHNAVENILLNVMIPLHNTTIMTGMISGLDESLSLTAKKIILSREPLATGDSLVALCRLHPDALKRVKRTNSFVIRSDEN